MESIYDILLVALAAVILASFSAFGFLTLHEGNRRATALALLIGMMSCAPLLLALRLTAPAKQYFLLGIIAVVGLIGILLLLPIGRVDRGDDRRTQRHDERDVVFARARLVPGSHEHEAYYNLRPHNLKPDDRIRALPGLLSMHAQRSDALIFPAAKASFDITEALREAVDGPIAAESVVMEKEAFTAFIKGWALHLGALDVGITTLQSEHVYSNIGRGTGTYGAPIELDHRYAIAFSVEMSAELMNLAPDAPVVMESAHKYVDSAVIAISLANLCRRLGYPARAHIDGNYRVIAPVLARDAGLGEIGRMGILMTRRQGPRVRLGVVTTNLPLMTDEPERDDSVIDFCEVCTKCALNCPSRAIPFGGRERSEGNLRWKLDEMKCYQYWNVIGTDCGLCMSVCPYAHPDHWLHNLVRSVIRRSGFARRVALWLDDLFYGRKPAPGDPPVWLNHSRAQESPRAPRSVD